MFDILIRGASLIDGTGAEARPGDVGIAGGRFTAVGHAVDGEAVRVIDGRGLVLVPGFIDIHCHSDVSHFTEPDMAFKLRQGVTLEVVGNCGTSLAPVDEQHRDAFLLKAEEEFGSRSCPVNWSEFGEYADALDRGGLGLSVMGLVGHNTLRVAAMGFAATAPDPSEMDCMRRLLAQSLEQGAVGLSTGLIYMPGCFADTGEVVALARIVREAGGFYASHMRNEAEGVLDAIDEVIHIGRKTGVPLHISHLKVAGFRNWHLAEQVAEKIGQARADGLDLTCDVYPYARSCTNLLTLIPPWALDGGVRSLLARLSEKAGCRRIVRDIREGLPGWENMYHNAGWDRITLASVRSDSGRSMQGKTLGQIASERGADPFETLLAIIRAEAGGVSIVTASMNEEIVARFLGLPFVMAGSDGTPEDGYPHPRVYGTFPRIIRKFVREMKAFSLETAVHKMTGMPARRLGLRDRGRIETGCRADAVLFDPASFSDTATYDNPRQFPKGLHSVIVNGQPVIDNAAFTGARPGRFLPRPTAF
ncbi:D-aminoacylase [Desulfonema ishimotonii]|uniref:D-aminoacylase n=1 Tax=Desulfonema ishimotonii TaxID=45657 RepID=A0A401FXX3_9BACT|nr:D-aminoacylase [Desulfonema ishimotonii]GBC61827.1 D-aminoacylase [Desulfonema ishimotonii]